MVSLMSKKYDANAEHATTFYHNIVDSKNRMMSSEFLRAVSREVTILAKLPLLDLVSDSSIISLENAKMPMQNMIS